MTKKRITKIFISLCIIALISFLLEFGHSTIKRIYIKNKYNTNTTNISDYKHITSEKNILNKPVYIEKLELYYSTSKDVEFQIIYTTNNEYKKTKDFTVNERFDNEINKQVINIKKEIKSLKLSGKDLNKVRIKQIKINNNINFNYYIYGYIYCILLLVYIIVNIYQKELNKKNIHKYFMIITFIIGSLFIFLQPASTFYSWDDQIHFTSTYELIGTKFKWKIGEFSMIDDSPIGLRSIGAIEEQEIQKNYLNQNKYSKFYSKGARFMTYSKYYYLIPAFGFNFGRLIGLPFTICFKMGKIMILLSYVLIMGYAIKISKLSKRLLCVIGLIPTNVFLASQYSYDPAVMSGLTLASVILFNWFIDKNEKVNFRSLLIFIISLLYASFVKAIYVPFLLLFLLVPKDRFMNNKAHQTIKILSLVLLILVMYTFVAPTITNSSIVGDTRGGDTSIAGQIAVILNNPLGYTTILYHAAVGHLFDYLIGASSLINYSYLGHLQGNIFYLYFMVIMFFTFTEKDSKQLDFKYRFPVIIISIGIIILIWTALYLSFTPVGSTEINGVQPRYFLPLIFPILSCFKSSKVNNYFSERICNVIVFAVPVLVILISIYKLVLIRFCL
ncbi:MAG: DUF2142 domain-containing protein [Bacilli bacterium]|nr:DUF2142 domain-containing protein [Bacilli bacterium]